ncbi:hypothetical protein [Methanosarcina barkeri]|uniref:hypothetical protein n=1 Tax=Methanosarcina barkeri TaxID=2208 RepID=UPI000AC2B814|nr:hypothetical protein [Methanosarcina barkeri]
MKKTEKNILRIEDESKKLKEAAKETTGFTDSYELPLFINELEEKESLLRERKNEASTKLALAFKEKETGDINLLTLDKELQNSRVAVRKSKTEIEILEEDLRENDKAVLEVKEQKSEASAGLKGLGFTGEQLEDLEYLSELLLENKNRLHGREKELEATVRELDKVIRKNQQLLAEGKCPTCGQDLKGSEIACTTGESEQKREKLAAELLDIKLQQAEVEKKLNRLKDAKKLEKRISDYDLETERLKNKAKDLQERISIHKTRTEEDSLKLEGLNKQKEELEAKMGKLLPDIKALQGWEAAAQKAHGESERVLREAKAFEKKLAENTSEIESLNGKIRTSLALIENYGQRLGELNEKIKGLAERETQEKEKLKTLEIELEALRKKEAMAKETHEESSKRLLKTKKLGANLIQMDNVKHKISELEASIRNLAEKVGFLTGKSLKETSG